MPHRVCITISICCSDCLLSYYKSLTLTLTHSLTLHSQKPWTCTIDNCGQKFTRRSVLRKHINKRHGGEFTINGVEVMPPAWDGEREILDSKLIAGHAAGGGDQTDSENEDNTPNGTPMAAQHNGMDTSSQGQDQNMQSTQYYTQPPASAIHAAAAIAGGHNNGQQNDQAPPHLPPLPSLPLMGTNEGNDQQQTDHTQ